MSDESELNDDDALGRAELRRVCGEESGGNAEDDEGVGSLDEDAEEEAEVAQPFLAIQTGRPAPLLSSILHLPWRRNRRSMPVPIDQIESTAGC